MQPTDVVEPDLMTIPAGSFLMGSNTGRDDERPVHSVWVDAFAIARAAGNLKAVNVALVGVLSRLLPVDESTWVEVIKQRLPAKIVEVNLAAFAEGRKAGE